MTTSNTTAITVECTVNAPIDKVWNFWTEPKHIMNWNNASPDWHTPRAENDLRVGGKFTSVMAAKDGSMSFEFGGEYTTVKKNEQIDYKLADDRTVKITFKADGDAVKVTETFDPESTNPRELQQGGWQAILDNFKKYTEEN